MRLRELQEDEGVTSERIKRLRREIPTRWHSRIGAMLTHLSQLKNIEKIATEFSIPSSYVPILTPEQQNTLAQIIYFLVEVRRVARELEADRKVTLSLDFFANLLTLCVLSVVRHTFQI